MRWLGLVLVAQTACVVDTGSAVGKPCPCPDDLACVSGVCRQPAGACAPLITAEGFRPTWATPEAIRWDWSPKGEAEDFSAYELVVGTSREDAATARGSARIFDATVNPELGFFFAPRESGVFEVDYTISDGLAPYSPQDATRYYAKLITRDVAGCEHETSVAESATSLAPVSKVDIFDDVLSYEVRGVPLTVESGAGVDGSAALRCSAADCLHQTGEWDNMRLVGSIDLTSISDNAVTSGQAYLELSIAVVSDTPIYYAEVALERDEGDTIRGWQFQRVHLRASLTKQFQKIQVPLNALLDVDMALDAATLAQPLDGLRVGADFANAADVYLDAIAVRW
ncbi:MAG: hypothetical protein KC731_24565 [Myxococcales bacterium]|nr:hypothetical protein [Myxococcales bacterium]